MRSRGGLDLKAAGDEGTPRRRRPSSCRGGARPPHTSRVVCVGEAGHATAFMMPRCQVGWRVGERPRWHIGGTITRRPRRRQMRRRCRPIRSRTHPRARPAAGRASGTACTGAGSTSPPRAHGRSPSATRPATRRPPSSDTGRDRRAGRIRPWPRPCRESLAARSPYPLVTHGRWWFTPSARWGSRGSRLRSHLAGDTDRSRAPTGLTRPGPTRILVP